ncbi:MULTISPECIES: MFS transporter [unclassified Bacillus (in: firmicutes)]|uniref:MFS transporter n=1 Tax=unclassified Bacillus (in: firmicutes) TaxID=185979 RepID=UPI001C3F1FF3|nr:MULTISPECIES: MFS transporter [unclassified Bacillus (in: firmicutes)]
MQVKSYIIPRLSAMMFFQYFTLGTWFATLGFILSKHGLSSIIGTAYSIGGIAAIISPIVIGMVSDRFFPSQKMLALVNIVGGILLWFLPEQIYTKNDNAFLWIMFLYMLCYNPTYSLTNNISFYNVKDTVKAFPIIRVCGTIGFIVASAIIGILGYSGSPVALQIGAVVSVLLGLYSFTLPNTPAPAKGKPLSIRDILCLDALQLLKNRYYLVFIVCTTVLFLDHATYMSFASVFLGDAGVKDVSSVMSIGQFSEVIFMLLLPFFYRRLGFKWMFLVGMIAWILRMSLFAFSAPEGLVSLMYIGIALHGLCWDFFFVSGYLYTDEVADEKIKGQAQGLIIMFTQGIGMFVGSYFAGKLFNNTVTKTGVVSLDQWQAFWMYPAIVAAIVAVVFFFFFKYKGLSSSNDGLINEDKRLGA